LILHKIEPGLILAFLFANIKLHHKQLHLKTKIYFVVDLWADYKLAYICSCDEPNHAMLIQSAELSSMLMKLK